MRLDEDSKEWNNLILQIVNDNIPAKIIHEEDYIQIPKQILLPPDQKIDDLISSVYGQNCMMYHCIKKS
jgi:hypothetical protein